MDNNKITKDILYLVDNSPLSEVNISELITEYTDGLEITKQQTVRCEIEAILIGLRKAGEIEYTDYQPGITSMSQQIFNSSSYKIKSSYKRQKKLEQIEIDKNKTPAYYTDNSIKAGGNIIGSNVTGSIEKSFNQTDLRSRETIQNANSTPAEKEKQQNAIVSFILKFWWVVLIPFLIGFALIAIEHNWFK